MSDKVEDEKGIALGESAFNKQSAVAASLLAATSRISVTSPTSAIGGMSGVARMNNLRAVEEIFEESWKALAFMGETIFHAMQNMGEVVAEILGLNQSRFQYVIDNMTEADWARARAVNKRRQAELSGDAKADDMEGGLTGAISAPDIKATLEDDKIQPKDR